jgi:uncharacterized protein YycO
MDKFIRLVFDNYIPILGAVLVALVVTIRLLNPGHSFQSSVLGTWLSHVIKGEVSAGVFCQPNRLDLNILEPGDIILVGNPGCGYGYYSHAAIYLGGMQTMEAYVDTGVGIYQVQRLRDYSRICVLRVEAPVKVRQAAADYARKQANKPVTIAFRSGQHYMSCYKLPWLAYARQGINLDPTGDILVKADAFPRSQRVGVLYREGDQP